MHRPQEQVRDFHRACGLPAPEHYFDPSCFDPVRRSLILEECDEFREAWAASSVTGCIDAACDMLYVIYGWAVAAGIDLEPYFEEVHMTNMKKASGPKREDGKQLKPEGWQPPRIQEMLNDGIGV